MKKYILIFILLAFQSNAQYNLFARQNFAKNTVVTYNTYIGGVSSTISTASALATKLGISVGVISNFTIVGSDIKCKITGSYEIPIGAFGNMTSLTYYRDIDGLVTKIKNSAFYNTSLSGEVRFDNCLVLETGAMSKNFATSFIFPKVTTTGDDIFDIVSTATSYYLPLCTTLGSTVLNNNVFRSIKSGAIIYVNPSLQTNNSGNPDGDLSTAITNGAIVRYVSNYTSPNPITDLAVGNIYNTAIQLNFTPPSSTNTIDYYEVYVNGIYSKNIYASGDYLTGLIASTSYSITVKAVDIYYNKSLVSNIITQSTNTTNPIIQTTGLVSYYKLDSNSNDSYGSNNGTDTSVSYVSGKISNAGSYNGSTSKTIIGNPTNLQLSTGTVSCWIKTSSPGGSYRNLFGKQSAYGMFLLDGILGYYNWGTFGGSGFKSTGVDLRDGNWHHLVFVFESGTANNKIYIDGVLKLTSSMSIGSQADNVGIGFYYSGQNINALFDECCIYNTKLTQNQIELIYNNGTGITL